MDAVDPAGLEFFNRLSGKLEIELTGKPQPITSRLLNVAASPGSTVVRISLRMRVFESGGFRDLTDDEWSRLVFRAPAIRMRSFRTNVVVEHAAPDNGSFTVHDVAAAVEETERRSRGTSEWFGGVDVHHTYFEGILDAGGVWEIHWGS